MTNLSDFLKSLMPERPKGRQVFNHGFDDQKRALLLVRGPCTITGKDYSVVVIESEWDDWQAGKLIQDAMPSLSADDREFLISGTSPEGWDKCFDESFKE